MKKFSFFIISILIAVFVMSFAACGGSSLSKPVGLRVDGDTLTLSWRAVVNARYYTVSINGEEYDSRTNSYQLAGLEEGDYRLRVKARGDDVDFRDSGWSETIEYSRAAEPLNMSFSLLNGKTEYMLVSARTAEGQVTVPDLYRGKPVTTIGEKAFSNSKVKEVVLGNNITTISAQAFNNCSYLEKINIPSGVKSIGAQAFQSCRLLSSPIVIGDNITEIPDNAFAYCRSLTEVTFGKNVKTIGANAFSDCEKLKEIILPDSLESVGDYAFSNCASAEELDTGDGVVTLGERAFYGCSAPEIRIGGSVEEIGNYAFANCANLTNINLPVSIKTVGEGAFYKCAALNGANLGSGVTYVGPDAFRDTAIYNSAEDLVYIDNWLVAYKSDAQNRLVPASFKSGVVGIGGRAFENHDELNQVTLPNTVKAVCDYAFANCDNLNTAALGSGCTALGDYAFANCPRLQTAVLGERITIGPNTGRINSVLATIGANAFNGCAMLGATANNLEIPSTVTSIGGNAFENTGYTEGAMGVVYAGNWAVDYRNNRQSMGLEEIADGVVGIADYTFVNSNIIYITMRDTVKHIGRGAFYNCKGLQAAFLSENLEEIEEYTFYGCSSLNLAALPSNITSIGRSAFYKCTKLGTENYAGGDITFEIPESVKNIGDYAFYGCGISSTDEAGVTTATGIANITMGGQVTRIGDFAFANMPALKAVTVPNSVTYLGDRAFYKCVSLGYVKLGSSITTIGEKTFYGCSSLEEIEIPDSVQNIGDYAFYKCSALNSAKIGSSVTSVGAYAFSGCSALTDINIPPLVTSVGKQAFRGCAIGSVTLGKNLAQIGVHAFYSDNNLTVYCELSAPAPNWNARFNTSYRPVVWGVTLSPDKEYVVSFTKTENSLSNFNSLTQVNPPEREGYTFGGWSLTPGGTSAYTANDLLSVPDGTTLYALWI